MGLGNAGTAQNNTTPWLKFLIDGKIVFVPKMTLRYSITWHDIYQAGCVYADDTYGLYPAGTPVLQNKRVTIRDYQFKVGLLSGANQNPLTNFNGGYDLPITHGSEWNRLFYNIVANNFNYPKASQEGDQWWNYDESEILKGLGNYAGYCLCKEHRTGSPLVRSDMNNRISYAAINWTFNTPYANTGWLPKLELIT